MSIQVGIIGCGGYAKHHAEGYKQIEEADVVALVDPDAGRREAFQQEHFPEAKLFASMEEMLADASLGVQGVSVVTPHTTHHPLCKQAMESGLHVLVEKPMTTSLPDAYDLWKTSNATGRKCMVAYQSIYSNYYADIVRRRDAGELGKLQVVSAFLGQGWRTGTTGKWRQEPGLSGGGFIYDSGAHVLNAVMYLVNRPVVEVAAYVDNVGTPVDINGVVAMTFDDGTFASVGLAGNTPGWYNRLTLAADDCVAITDAHAAFYELYRKNDAIEHGIEKGGDTPQRNFLDVIQQKADPIGPPRLGCLLSAMMDALYESASSRAPVKVEPVPDAL